MECPIHKSQKENDWLLADEINLFNMWPTVAGSLLTADQHIRGEGPGSDSAFDHKS